ncbi:hypothetical protein C8R46DRAFT_1074677, partial [Mycena filopes]
MMTTCWTLKPSLVFVLGSLLWMNIFLWSDWCTTPPKSIWTAFLWSAFQMPRSKLRGVFLPSSGLIQCGISSPVDPTRA